MTVDESEAGPDRTAGSDEELLELASDLARRAGLLVEEMRADAVTTSETKSSSTDLVTAADRAAEDLIVAGLAEARPFDAILGEEGAGRQGSSGVRWLIDPIDGTTNYVYDVPAYSVSIAAELHGRVTVGVVYDPRADELYEAARGSGAFVDGSRLRASTKSDLATALVSTGFGYTADRRRGQAEVLLELLPEIRDIRRFGSAALDLCGVAVGRVDAYFERGLNPWDLAAGALIAEEAGARVGDLRGGEPSEQYVLAASPDLFDRLQQRLAELGADRAP